MELKQFIQLFANAIESPKCENLSGDEDFRAVIETWDSLAGLMAIAWIKSDFNVDIAAADFINCRTLKELYEKVSSLKTE